VGEIEAANAGFEDRNPIRCLHSRRQEGLAQPLGLASEHQEISRSVIGIEIGAARARRKILYARTRARAEGYARLRFSGRELIPSRMRAQIDQGPVVETGTL